ncbi:hypothetical protein D2E83_11435 [Mycobacteroides abscessus]|nr:hypothetical protein DDJ40_08430 [Mycobacteroides abscessus]RIU40374.1 hypothetical protein D2E83_11435 [Mycobacteroides abscessus]
MSAEFTAKALELMQARSGGDCEVMWPGVCGGGALQFHHRRTRGMGGTKRLSSKHASNGLAACLWCHGHLEHGERLEAREFGFLVSQSAEPAKVPVFYRFSRWVLLSDDGTVESWLS